MPVDGHRPDLTQARAHLRRWGWQVHQDAPALVLLAQALVGENPAPRLGQHTAEILYDALV
jgi:hypothetical protein